MSNADELRRQLEEQARRQLQEEAERRENLERERLLKESSDTERVLRDLENRLNEGRPNQ